MVERSFKHHTFLAGATDFSAAFITEFKKRWVYQQYGLRLSKWGAAFLCFKSVFLLREMKSRTKSAAKTMPLIWI